MNFFWTRGALARAVRRASVPPRRRCSTAVAMLASPPHRAFSQDRRFASEEGQRIFTPARVKDESAEAALTFSSSLFMNSGCEGITRNSQGDALLGTGLRSM